jgi:hypothetical protein
VKARFSQCYDRANSVFEYCAVEVYLHAFSETALDGDLPLTSISDGYFPTERTTGKHLIGYRM